MKKKILYLACAWLPLISFSACAQRVVYTRGIGVSRSVTVVRAVPHGATVVVHGGVSYHYVNGVYYRPYGAGFCVVTPPLGIHVNILPVGYVAVTLGGLPYFCAGGTYYCQTAPNIYEVVAKPAEVTVAATALNINNTTVVASLPEGTKVIIINNKRYYKVNDTYYEKSTSENGDTDFRLIGKIQ